MNDETKAAVEWLRACAKVSPRPMNLHAAAILAHIDGEPARLAAAREEQREWCARRVGEESREFERMLRKASTLPTPLADELRTQREATFQAIDRHQQAHARAEFFKGEMEELRGERDALRARVAKLEREREGLLMGGVTVEARQQLERAERAEAQVAAARAVCEAVMCGSDCDRASCSSSPCVGARLVLRAMDEAAKR